MTTQNHNKDSTNIAIAGATILSLGVLSGCEYCEPLLLATLVTATLKGLYGAATALYQAMQIRPCSR